MIAGTSSSFTIELNLTTFVVTISFNSSLFMVHGSGFRVCGAESVVPGSEEKRGKAKGQGKGKG